MLLILHLECIVYSDGHNCILVDLYRIESSVRRCVLAKIYGRYIFGASKIEMLRKIKNDI